MDKRHSIFSILKMSNIVRLHSSIAGFPSFNPIFYKPHLESDTHLSGGIWRCKLKWKVWKIDTPPPREGTTSKTKIYGNDLPLRRPQIIWQTDKLVSWLVMKNWVRVCSVPSVHSPISNKTSLEVILLISKKKNHGCDISSLTEVRRYYPRQHSCLVSFLICLKSVEVIVIQTMTVKLLRVRFERSQSLGAGKQPPGTVPRVLGILAVGCNVQF